VAYGAITFSPDSGTNETDHSIGRVILPTRALANGRLVFIAIETDIRHRVCDLKPGSPDERRLGLGLSAFILEAQSNAGDATGQGVARADQGLEDVPATNNISEQEIRPSVVFERSPTASARTGAPGSIPDTGYRSVTGTV
jgi:hypothetical protein